MATEETTTTTATDEMEETSPPVQEIFHLDLHAWIEVQQNSHGVRHDDYGQYHGYCTRRLARLSHLPEAKKYLVCSSKFATVKSDIGKGVSRHTFCSRQLDTFHEDMTYVPHVNVLWYLLVLSERSWAHANQLQKQEKKSRSRVLKKLKKATKWATLLLNKAQLCADPTTLQECQAYASWIQANYALEKLDYQTASQEFAKAMQLCQKLSQSATSEGSCSNDDNNEDHAKVLERQDLFLTRCDTVLRPLFRYCQYELKQAGQPLMDEPSLATTTTTNTTTSGGPSDEDSSFSFRGQDLVVESKELRVVLLKLQSMQQDTPTVSVTDQEKLEGDDEEEKQQESKETTFINILSVLDDALEIVQGVLATLDQAQTGPAVQARRQQYLLWKGYLQWKKTSLVMDHTAKLLDTIDGHAEKVHVYDALLQHAQTLLDLPRPSNDEEEEDEFALQAQANILRLRAMKTYHMAWYYYERPQNYDAALALQDHASRLSKRAQEEIAACDEDMPNASEYVEALENLPLNSLRAAIQAALYLEGATQDGKVGRRRNTDRPLWLRYQDNDAGSVLAGDIQPIPVPCKPVFFDLALGYALDPSTSIDYIETFVQEHTVSAEPVEEEAPKTVGLFGWLTGGNS